MQTDSDSNTAWAGLAMFAGFMMILIGAFQAIAGLVGIIDDQFSVLGVKYVFEFDMTTWGWIHLIAVIVVFLAGLAVFKLRVGAHRRRDRRDAQRDRELRLPALLPGVVDHHHHRGRAGDMGAHRPWSRARSVAGHGATSWRVIASPPAAAQASAAVSRPLEHGSAPQLPIGEARHGVKGARWHRRKNCSRFGSRVGTASNACS